ncbi:Exosome complex component MTR3, partial [Dissostichus eleginoides]
ELPLRVPLWLPSWPSMPEVPYQSHVTLVPDTLVFTVSADGRGPLQKRPCFSPSVLSSHATYQPFIYSSSVGFLVCLTIHFPDPVHWSLP